MEIKDRVRVDGWIGTIVGFKSNGQVLIEDEDGDVSEWHDDEIRVLETLEADFEILRKQVNEKIALAAAIIDEATALAGRKQKDLDSRDVANADDYGYDRGEFLFDSMVLLNAIDRAGWHASTMTASC